MRNIMIFAAFMIGLGTFMAQMADKMTPAPALPTTAARKAPAVETVGQAGLSQPQHSRATPAVISRPKAGSTASASASWSIPARP